MLLKIIVLQRVFCCSWMFVLIYVSCLSIYVWLSQLHLLTFILKKLCLFDHPSPFHIFTADCQNESAFFSNSNTFSSINEHVFRPVSVQCVCGGGLCAVVSVGKLHLCPFCPHHCQHGCHIYVGGFAGKVSTDDFTGKVSINHAKVNECFIGVVSFHPEQVQQVFHGQHLRGLFRSLCSRWLPAAARRPRGAF